MAGPISISAGAPGPLGAVAAGVGVNVAVFSANAERIWFCPFDATGERELARLPLERIGDTHFGYVTGIGAGTRYGLRADGPFDPARGHRFDPSKLLVDPYAESLDRAFAWHADLAAPRAAGIDTARLVPKAFVRGWPLDKARRRNRDAVPPRFVYEVNVRAFSQQHPAVPGPFRGTVAGLAHPAVVEHLASLGVDTVELMPIAAWIDERHLPPLGLRNAWGYNPVVFTAPDPRLAPGGLAEVRAAVATLQDAGIRVVLDVVYNHTGEGDLDGPTLSLRGLDNAVYYRHAAGQPGRLVNDTGTGNTLACDHPAVVRLVVESMRRWIEATGVDGFRLDLATILGRTAEGFRPDAPLIAAIEADAVLARAVMIAEPWDVGPGGYRLGYFPNRYLEWNDRFRDDVRRFWRGDRGSLGGLATRLAGSSDIFARPGRAPSASVNFIAAHDGFTLADLVSHTAKRNHANGEANRDGTDDNTSWNHGIEGAADDPEVLAARRRDIHALLATLFVARGTPMLTAGDEFGRSQGGNNNAYAQDTPLTWLDWEAADRDLAAFVARLSRLRAAHPSLSADRFLAGRPVEDGALPDVAWLHPEGREVDVGYWEGDGRMLGVALLAGDDRTVIWFNGAFADADAWLPAARPGRAWKRAIVSSGGDPDQAGTSAGPAVLLPARSVTVFAEAAA